MNSSHKAYWLNNSGTRVSYRDKNNNSDRVKVLNMVTKEIKSYAVTYWKQIGSFMVPYVKIKGKREQLTHSNQNDGTWMVNSSENRAVKYGRQ